MTSLSRRSRRPGRRARVLVGALVALIASVAGFLAPVTVTAPAAAVETGGARPLLVILLNRVGGPGLAHPPSWYEQLFFGPSGTTAIPEYFSTNSRGRFTFRRAGLLSFNDVNDPSLGEAVGDDLPALVRGINLAGRSGWNFRAWDTNRDGTVSDSELAIMVVDNYSESAGAARNYCGRIVGNAQVAQPNYCGRRAAAGHRSGFTNVAHELAHTLHPMAQDLYFNGCRSQNLTLMSCTGNDIDQRYKQVLLDPWHRVNYGWISELPHQTNVWPLNNRSTVNLTPACRATQVATIVRNSGGNVVERFLIENRQACSGDSSVGSAGVVVWYQRDDPGNGDRLYSAFDTNVALRSIGCVFSAAHAQNRDAPRAVTTGRHRLWWGDGTETGADLVIGTRWADGTIPVTITRTNNAPASSC